MREKTIKYHHYKWIWAISTVLWCLSHLAQWHNVLAFRTSRTSGKHPGKHRHFRMTLWHAGTLLAWLACWHSRQTHGTGTHHSLNLETLLAHTRWCGWFMVDEDGDVWWSDVDLVVDPFSESEQAINQSTLRKLAQPHKPKEIDPNLEI